LEIEPAGDAVDVEQFAAEIKSRREPALHGFEIHFAQTHPAAGDKLLLVKASSHRLQLRAGDLFDETMPGGPRQSGPARRAGNAGGQHQAFPEPRGQRRQGGVDDESRGLSTAAQVQLCSDRLTLEVRQPVDA
jgi:hypothetical protein